MMEELRTNIQREREIIEEINKSYESLESMKDLSPESVDFYKEAVTSLKNQIKIINDSTPLLLSQISMAKPLKKEQPKPEKKDVVTISYVSPVTQKKKFMTIKKADEEKFAKELRVSEETLAGLKKKEKAVKQEQEIVVKQKNEYARISNKFFLSLSEKLSPSFKDIKEDMKKGNMNIMLTSYLSIAFFSSLLVFLVSVIVMGALILYGWIFMNSLSYLKFAWIPLVVPIFSLVFFYVYPSTQKSSFDKKIAYELPFATIYMSAIAGSNIEPSKIFKIIATSGDYPAISTEIKKLMNQVDVYGYDLVTALKNSARLTPNKKLAELFGGIATNIISGGSLKDYLEKKSENLLLDYKWERQKYNALAETFMDVYISLLITAPMILVMMVVILNVTEIKTGLPFNVLMILSISAVVLVNIIFMVALQVKQPKI